MYEIMTFSGAPRESGPPFDRIFARFSPGRARDAGSRHGSFAPLV